MSLSLQALLQKRADDGFALAYSDLLLEPAHSAVMPRDADPSGRFSRTIPLSVPFVSAAMSTVTTASMAIAMATHGGIGVIHPAMDPEEQRKMVRKVKLRLNGLIDTPVTIRAQISLEEVRQLREDKGYGFETFPVVDDRDRLVGIITSNDFKFWPDPSTLVSDAMTPYEKIVHGKRSTTPEEARTLMRTHRVRVLPLVDDDRKLVGLYVSSDVERVLGSRKNYTLDAQGHLRVAASIGTLEDAYKRAELLASVGCDAFVVGTAHADTQGVLETVHTLKHTYPHIDIVAGNTSYDEGAKRLAQAGADGILVGQGPGSICTTRIVAGIGIPQASAVFECVQALKGSGVPIIADGGITTSGDIVKALAIGASAVMLGGLLAGTDEAPGEKVYVNGQPMKEYFGMGSGRAMREHAASRKRYGQQGIPSGKHTPEGVEGRVPYRGPIESVINELLGGVRSGMGYLGAKTIEDMRAAHAVQITQAGYVESRPHNIYLDHSE
ncbi:IMP dehydrogenase [Candidatus Kaiserbacteria bacterium]|nr:IMP dehydrogenase [Candidatus Kaiserbacteria bacterium]